MEPEGSLPYSQQPDTDPYPEPDESSPYLPTLFPEDPASYPMRTGGSFAGVKRPGREADHSPPSNAEVK
jgi:hypothetical protein